MQFKNRTEAGYLMAKLLKSHKENPGLVLSVLRGGIPIAYEVAKELGLPKDVVLTKKIGHPLNKDYAIGAASLTDYFFIPDEQVPESYIQREVEKIQSKLKEFYIKLLGHISLVTLSGKTVLIIDDGMATGNTLFSSVNVLKKLNPEKLIVAVPVATENAVTKLSGEVDEVIALNIPEEFHGVGSFYEDFEQVTDRQVVYYLDKIINNG